MAESCLEADADTALKDISSIDWATPPRFIDVRSPAEFREGHVPGAFNVPLFSDNERAEIGTLYKRVSRQAAINKGLELVAPKLADLVDTIRDKGGESPLIYCWRGGMRSESLCRLLKTSGVNCMRLTGGYKAYRQLVRNSFSLPMRLLILGGYTGSGKTALLHLLAKENFQILDLEGLANHKGSAFGHLNEKPQPTSEQFSNLIFTALQGLDPACPIVVENESRVIGKVHLPEAFFSQMRSAPLLSLKVPMAARIDRLIEDYAHTPKTDLIKSTRQIAKKLGLEKVKKVEAHIKNDRFDKACAILLSYYDTYYDRGVFRRKKDLVHILELDGHDLEADTVNIKEKIMSLFSQKAKEKEEYV